MNSKKQIFLVTSIFLLGSTLTLAADKCANSMGNMTVGKVTIQCLNAAGSVHFTGTTIPKTLHVAGPLDAKSSQLNEIYVAGNVTLDETMVSGDSKIAGSLVATNSTFQKKILIAAGPATFNHSTTQDIQVKSLKRNQVSYVYLTDHSVVNGNIEFTNGKGIVKNSDSTIKGKVMGGKVE